MRHNRPGLTLMELIVVLVILVALAGIVVPLISNTSEETRVAATRESMLRIRDAILDRYWPEMASVNAEKGIPGGYPHPHPASGSFPGSGARQVHPQLVFLFISPDPTATDPSVTYNPTYKRGWHGPYLQSNSLYKINALDGFVDDFGLDNDPAILDSWGRPIVIQRPVDGSATVDQILNATRLVSAGPNGKITTTNALIPASIDDDIIQLIRIGGT